MTAGPSRARGRSWTLAGLDRSLTYRLEFSEVTRRWECFEAGSTEPLAHRSPVAGPRTPGAPAAEAAKPRAGSPPPGGRHRSGG